MKKARKINLMGSSARVYIKTSFWEQISCVFRTKSIFGDAYIHLPNNALIKSPLRIVIYRVNFILISAALILELIHSSPVETNPHFS